MKILTYNIWNVPGSPDRRLRMNALAKSLQKAQSRGAGWDLVLLQELWPWTERGRFDACGLDHAIGGDRPFTRPVNWLTAPFALFGAPWIVDSGLRTLSRHRVTASHRMAYARRKDTPAHERRIRKGALAVRVETPTLGPVWVVNTHLIAQIRGATRNAQRWAQLQELRAFIDRVCVDAPVILAGDLNMGPPLPGSHAALDEPDFWDRALAGPLSGFAPARECLDQATWSEGTNPYVALDPDREEARLDHVLVGPGLTVRHSVVRFREALLEAPRGRRPLSDHYALEIDIALA